jgi:hypothetical protein
MHTYSEYSRQCGTYLGSMLSMNVASAAAHTAATPPRAPKSTAGAIFAAPAYCVEYSPAAPTHT